MPNIATDVTTENWRDSDTHLTVTQPHGYFCNLQMLARVNLSPEEVFSILTDPDNFRIFKAIKAVRNRTVVESDGHGRQVVDVEQLGQWRFLCFKGTFTTRLRVEEDKRTRSIRFHLTQPGFMSKFSGSWRIEPFNQDSLDALANGKPHHAHHAAPLHSLADSFRHLQDRLHGRHPSSSSLVQLEHSLALAFTPPPPTDKLVKRIAAKQLMTIMGQLRDEADRINRSRQQPSGGGERSKGGAVGEQTGSAKNDKELSTHVRAL